MGPINNTKIESGLLFIPTVNRVRKSRWGVSMKVQTANSAEVRSLCTAEGFCYCRSAICKEGQGGSESAHRHTMLKGRKVCWRDGE